MSMSVVSPALAPEAASGGRSSIARLRGAPVPVSCPSWCTTHHGSDDLVELDDLSHESAPVALSVPTFGGREETVLVARLVQWPFARESEPYLSLDAKDGSDAAALPATAAIAYTDQIVAHANAIRGLANVLAGGVA